MIVSTANQRFRNKWVANLSTPKGYISHSLRKVQQNPLLERRGTSEGIVIARLMVDADSAEGLDWDSA
jgi:hypothetical protein